jgi:hypothetical protein
MCCTNVHFASSLNASADLGICAPVCVRVRVRVMCRHGIKTRCFPFQLHAVAPIATNGWILTGETSKMLPISSARIASITVVTSGGFTVSLKGAAKETVTMGAVDVEGGKAPVYATATIGADGTATLTVG